MIAYSCYKFTVVHILWEVVERGEGEDNLLTDHTHDQHLRDKCSSPLSDSLHPLPLRNSSLLHINIRKAVWNETASSTFVHMQRNEDGKKSPESKLWSAFDTATKQSAEEK